MTLPEGRRKRDLGRIVSTKDTLHGKPRIAGTRIPTRAVWGFWAAEYSRTGIIDNYPSLTDEDIGAAIRYEAKRRRKKGKKQ